VICGTELVARWKEGLYTSLVAICLQDEVYRMDTQHDDLGVSTLRRSPLHVKQYPTTRMDTDLVAMDKLNSVPTESPAAEPCRSVPDPEALNMAAPWPLYYVFRLCRSVGPCLFDSRTFRSSLCPLVEGSCLMPVHCHPNPSPPRLLGDAVLLSHIYMM
jgi:hypothetical protein